MSAAQATAVNVATVQARLDCLIEEARRNLAASCAAGVPGAYGVMVAAFGEPGRPADRVEAVTR